MSDKRGWIGVDFDGTLALYAGNHAILGPPIPRMVARVKQWLADGREVRIFTARVSMADEVQRNIIIGALQAWCVEYIGQSLPVTNAKDFYMVELWDDRAVTVIKNTGLSWREHQKRVTHTRRG